MARYYVMVHVIGRSCQVLGLERRASSATRPACEHRRDHTEYAPVWLIDLLHTHCRHVFAARCRDPQYA